MEFDTIREMIRFFHEKQEPYMDKKSAKEFKEYLYLMLICEKLERRYGR